MADEALLTTPTSPPSIISTQDSPLLLSPTGLANSTPTHERSRKQIRRHSAPERHVQEDDIEVADRRRVTVHDPSRRDSFASATSEGSWLSTSFISDINLAARLSSPTSRERSAPSAHKHSWAANCPYLRRCGPPPNLSADSRKIGAAKRPKLHPLVLALGGAGVTRRGDLSRTR